MIEEQVVVPSVAAVGSSGWETSARDHAMSAARDELALISAQLNDGHTRLVALMRRVLAEELWCGAGFRSPEQWLTAYAGLTWSSAHDIVRIAQRAPDLPTMQRLLDDGRLTLGQAAVVAKYTPAAYDADVAQFASYTTVTQLRRALCRYEFNADKVGATVDTPVEQSAVLPGDAAADEELVELATDSAVGRAPDSFDPATAAPRLDMRYAAGRFVLSYDAPADIGALVEQALLEAKDTLFRLTTPDSDSDARPAAGTCGIGTVDAAKSHKGASFGEAMGLLAQRSLGTGAPIGHSRASRYRVYLHLDTSGSGWLNKRGALPPALRARILCDGAIRPVWETEGKPVSVGRTQRIVPHRTRHLLEDRDRGCRYPGCLAMHHLECHHLDHWIDGGQTDADRLIMLCPFHHDEHHRGAFVMVGDPSRPDGVVFTARDGTPIRPEFRPYEPTPPRTPDASNHAGVRENPERTKLPFAPYQGPTNDKLHLALVQFDPRPANAPPRTCPDTSSA
ncbi:HNH endonuclease signature motif containing protein [Flexivirga caeni]|uniref:HNH endonuclease n=1 Tax=Flexivirga caeni TaxID=2294115 RepID=A0A3M9M3Y2_9MICO|nr:HNH endonuclease signature motif containing protein [Flexivirga caeni]RNI20284.1 HNH endonuclease [Flexivirga caeni]